MKKFKLLFVLLICFTVILISGCVGSPFTNSRTEMLDELTGSAAEQNLKTSQDVIQCFNDDDAASLKSLLSMNKQGIENIDQQIITGLDFINGKVVSFDEENLTSYEGQSNEPGEITELERSWTICDIKTDLNETYEVYIFKYYICKEEVEREGISWIIITDSAGQEVTIGYR